MEKFHAGAAGGATIPRACSKFIPQPRNKYVYMIIYYIL